MITIFQDRLQDAENRMSGGMEEVTDAIQSPRTRSDCALLRYAHVIKRGGQGVKSPIDF